MKAWWGLAASVLSLLIILVGYVAMSAGLPTAERLSTNELLPGIDVPDIGTVGDFPDPKRRHVVNVTADGRIWLEGKWLSFEELGAELTRRAEISGEPIPGTTERMSCECVVLRVDGAVPWRAACALVRECSRPKIGNILFAVRHESTGTEGALAVFLPTFGDISDAYKDSSYDIETRVVAENLSGPGGPADAFALLRARGPEALIAHVHLEADPALPTRVALGLMDAALRAGARSPNFFGLAGKPPLKPQEDFEAAFAPGHTAPAGCAVRIEPAVTRGNEERMPPTVPVRGRLVGLTWGHDHAEPRYGEPCGPR